MKIFITFFLILVTCNVVAQIPEIDWMKRYGGISNDLFSSLIVTTDGGLLLGGTSNSDISGNKTANRIGWNQDYWVVKTDILGAIQWQQTIGGGSSDLFNDLEADILKVVRQAVDGGYFLGGNSDSPIFGSKTVPNYGFQDYWIVKLNSQGGMLWQANIGGSNYDECFALEPTPDGGCIVGGFSQSGISGNKIDANRGGKDYWVVKLNSMGQIQWQKTYGGAGLDILYAIVVLDNNDYILTGISTSNISGEKTANSKGGGDFWILKINQEGTIIWQKTIGGNSADAPYNALKVNDGFVFGGTSYSDISFDKSQNSRGEIDYWLVKTDFDGNVLWDKTFGGDLDDYLLDFLVLADGSGFVLAGVSRSPVSGDKTVLNYGQSDGWVIKTDQNGELLWQKGIGGSFLDGFSEVVQLPNQSIVLGGNSFSPISGNITDAGFNSTDYWLVNLVAEQLNNNNVVLSNFNIYPNPTNKDVTVNFGKSQEKITVLVYNSLAQVVQKLAFSNTDQISFSINNPPGIYFLKMINQVGYEYQCKILKK